jgi:5-bromo-4-chloroindolyl phosphate hydrolysis protein
LKRVEIFVERENLEATRDLILSWRKIFECIRDFLNKNCKIVEEVGNFLSWRKIFECIRDFSG